MSPVGAIQVALGDCCGQDAGFEFGVDCAIDADREGKVHNEMVRGQTLKLIHQLSLVRESMKAAVELVCVALVKEALPAECMLLAESRRRVEGSKRLRRPHMVLKEEGFSLSENLRTKSASGHG
jgi:hypothetical protein